MREDSRWLRGKSGSVPQAIRVNLAVKELTVSFVDAAPAEVCVLTVRSVRAAARVGGGADAVVNVKIEHVQLDNHCPGSPYPVAFKSRCEPGTLALDVVAVAGSDGGGVKIVKVLDVTFPAGVDVKFDVSFAVRLQMMWKSMMRRVGRKGGSGGAELAEAWARLAWGAGAEGSGEKRRGAKRSEATS